jgi:hypothetical protein
MDVDMLRRDSTWVDNFWAVSIRRLCLHERYRNEIHSDRVELLRLQPCLIIGMSRNADKPVTHMQIVQIGQLHMEIERTRAGHFPAGTAARSLLSSVLISLTAILDIARRTMQGN